MFWSHVGFYLGINEEFLPRSFDNEISLYNLKRQHFNPDDLSAKLSRVSIVCSSHLPPLYLGTEMTSARCWNMLGESEKNTNIC
jgi:hypothetical protein